MKKKNLLLALLLAAGFLSACGEKDTTTTTTTDDQTNITIPTSDDSSTDISFDPGEKRTVQYDLNYSSKPILYFEDEVDAGSLLIAPTIPTRRGYDFLKWWKDPYCRAGTDWKFATNIIIENMTLYASWERNNDDIGEELLTVSYEGAGASFVPVDELTLPREVEETTTIRFKISIFDDFEGTPIIKANTMTLTANGEGIYSYTVVTNVVFSVSGLTQKTTATYRVYYTNLNNWTSVNAYFWDEGSDPFIENVVWPGEVMFYDAEKANYFIDIDPNIGYDKVIFNDGSSQTEDLELVYFGTSGTIYMGLGSVPTAHKYEGQSEDKPDYSFATLGLRGAGSGLSWQNTNVHFINKDGETYLDIQLEAGTLFKLYDDVYGWNNNTVGLMTGAASTNFGIDDSGNNNIKVLVSGNYHLLWDGATQKVVVTLN